MARMDKLNMTRNSVLANSRLEPNLSEFIARLTHTHTHTHKHKISKQFLGNYNSLG